MFNQLRFYHHYIYYQVFFIIYAHCLYQGVINMGTSENKLLFDLLKKKVIMLVLSFASNLGKKGASLFRFNQNMIKLNYYMYLLLYLSLSSHQFERNKVMQYHKYITCICLIILKLIVFLQFEEKESHTLLQEHTEYFCAEGLMRYSVIFYCYKCVQFFICKLDLSNCFSLRRQHGRVVSTSDLQCSGPGFFRVLLWPGHYLDLFFVGMIANTQPCL